MKFSIKLRIGLTLFTLSQFAHIKTNMFTLSGLSEVRFQSLGTHRQITSHALLQNTVQL